MKYRREIDGLRSFAVLPVIFFHAGFSIFSGGYVGVDVFFVISGYLITTIIVSEKESDSFSIVKFYERRARRILPALFFVVLVSLPFAWAWMLPEELTDYSRSLVAVAAFSSNILFWLESGYFESAAELKPFLHTWSLAVEEQYYLFFPLLIVLLWRFGNRVICWTLLALGAASLLTAQLLSGVYPSANFYLLPSRLWELLIGSLIAIFLFRDIRVWPAPGDRRYQSIAEAASLLGLLLILYAVFFFTAETPFPSLYTLVPTIGTGLIIVFASDKTLVGKMLSFKPLVGIGLVSYSAYLWHQPLFAFARLRSIGEPDHLLMGFLGLLSLILAFFSWKYVEQPFRDKRTFSRERIFQGAFAASILVLALGLSGHFGEGFDGRTTRSGVSYADAGLDHRIRSNHGLSKKCDGAFTLTRECRTDDEPEILVWGDSFAMHLVEGILASNPDARLIQMTKSVCGPIVGIAPTNADWPPAWSDRCIAFNDRVIAWLEENESIRYVVLASPFNQYLDDNWRIRTRGGIDQAGSASLSRQLALTVEAVSNAGAIPVVFAPPPSNGNNLGNCLARAVSVGEDLAKCNFELLEYEDRNADVIALLSSLQETVRVVWPAESLCDDQVCTASIDGVFVYRDRRHYSYEGSAVVGKTMNFYERITADATGDHRLGQPVLPGQAVAPGVAHSGELAVGVRSPERVPHSSPSTR